MIEFHTPTPDSTGPRGLAALLEAMRLPHWIKNGFVVAPILFSRRYDQPWAWANVALAVLAMGLLSSAGYLLNDLHDKELDRAHPVKRRRPVASGRLSGGVAGWAAAVLAALGLALAAAVGAANYSPSVPLAGLGLTIWAGCYLLLEMLYTWFFKKRVVLDVVVVALLFVLRAMAGAGAIVVPISPWLVVCTFTLCLFIALTKRRSEIADLPAEQAAAARLVNRWYDARDLEHMLTVSSALAIVTYSIYCLAPSTVTHLGSPNMVWTIPLVVYGLFRYNLITRLAGRGDPVSVLLGDKGMWAVLLAYLAVSALVIQFGSAQPVRSVLEMPH